MCDGIPEENLIGFPDLIQLSAEFITSQIINHLSDSGYSAEHIISAMIIMSGIRSGLQAKNK